MEGDMCILQVRGVRPFLSKKYDITRHPLYKFLSDFDKRNTFDIEKYLSTKLKVKPNDVFEVYDINLAEPPPPGVFVSQ
jgi:type IV secretion system protein VirD4